ncbi:MAG TPA: MarR family transcriptional regulator [Gemmatimonadales bacterium]|nr:MarR family transcriptional regulator [Gemmatimonadales bacterium]
MHAATADFVERVALFFEDEGFSRIAGRIFGRLLLSAEPLSLDALAEELAVSKASVSTETRTLEHRGLLERVGRPGDRKVYYQVGADLPIRTMELRLDRIRRFQLLMHDAPAPSGPAARTVRSRLREIESAYEHVQHVVGGAVAEWRRRTARRRSAAS